MGLQECRECKKSVSSDAKSCPNCGAPVKKPVSRLLKIVGGILAFFLFAGFVGSLVDQGKNAPPRVPATQEKKYNANQHLDLARQDLAAGYKPDKDITKATWGNVAGAKAHLVAIKSEDKEYFEAQSLLKEVARREREISKATVIIFNKQKIKTREEFASRFERDLLSKGMDVDASVSGPEKTAFKMKYVLLGRPLVYKLTVEGNILKNLYDMGFTRAILTDGYNNTWDFDLKKRFSSPKAK